MKIHICTCDSDFNLIKGSTEFSEIVKEIGKLQVFRGEISLSGQEYIWKRESNGDLNTVVFVDISEITELTKLAWLDQLTQVFNRNAYWSLLQLTVEECKRENLDIAVIFVDIDNLKQINQDRGHLGGDEAIKGVAQTVQKAVRKTDLVFRIGGDEFIVVCKFKKDEYAGFHKLLDRIHTKIDATSQIYSTASFGGVYIDNSRIKNIGTVNSLTEDWNTIVAIADAQAYKSKNEGKNRYNIVRES